MALKARQAAPVTLPLPMEAACSGPTSKQVGLVTTPSSMYTPQDVKVTVPPAGTLRVWLRPRARDSASKVKLQEGCPLSMMHLRQGSWLQVSAGPDDLGSLPFKRWNWNRPCVQCFIQLEVEHDHMQPPPAKLWANTLQRKEGRAALAQPVDARGEALVVGALGLRAVDRCIAVAHYPLQVAQVLLGGCAGGCRTIHGLRTSTASHGYWSGNVGVEGTIASEDGSHLRTRGITS